MNYNGYIYRNSLIHKMNPSLKFITTILFIVMIFIPYGFLFQIILFFIITSIYVLAKLPFRKYLKIFQTMVIMMVVLLFVNWIAYKGPGIVFDLSQKADLLYKPYWLYPSNNVFIDPYNRIFLQGYMYGGSPFNVNQLDLSLTINNVSTPISIIQIPGSNGFYEYKLPSGVDTNKLVVNINDMVNGLNNSLSSGSIGYNYQIANFNNEQWLYVYLYVKQWYSFSSDAIILMLYVTFKIFLMILVVSILTSTTSSLELTSALEDILNPLRIFRLPINEWSTTIALAIRFIPSLLDESNKIMKAQASRGLDFSNGNLKDKMHSLTSLIVPLFSIAFRKADELANAMEARNYNPRTTRTRYREFKINFFDWISFAFFCLLLGFLVTISTFNGRSLFFSPLGILEAIIMYS